MKKKFLAILKEFNCEMIQYKHWKPNFDWNNYEIEYKDKDSNIFLWDWEINIWDKNENSITNNVGALEYFRKSVMDNCA